MELDGQLESYCEKWNAELAVLRVGSVKAVADEIKVGLRTSATRADADIAKQRRATFE